MATSKPSDAVLALEENQAVTVQLSSAFNTLDPLFSEEVFNQIGDPDPPPQGFPADVLAQYRRNVDVYAMDMLTAFKETEMYGESL
ncbi:hypothetical protein FGB62_144g01 [Gracilaria domingensis]|nr:hypothetical protein FGB62_144g01 [Gracilaria domingensis]